jgi:hypothetical protein
MNSYARGSPSPASAPAKAAELIGERPTADVESLLPELVVTVVVVVRAVATSCGGGSSASAGNARAADSSAAMSSMTAKRTRWATRGFLRRGIGSR